MFVSRLRHFINGFIKADSFKRRFFCSPHARPRAERLEDRVCPSVFYDFEVIAQTGAGPYNLTSLGKGVSINDNGYVAFTGESDNFDGNPADNLYAWNPNSNELHQLMNRIFMYTNTDAQTLTPGTQAIYHEVQINNNNDILARRRLNAGVQVGFPTGSILTAPLSYLETWNADAGNPPGVPSKQVAMGLPGGPSAPLWFFLNPVTGGVYPSPLNLSSPYEGLFNSSTINNLSQVNFSAIVRNVGNNRISSNTDGALIGRGDIGNLVIHPMLADNGQTVITTSDGRIFTEAWDLSGGLHFLAGPSTGFTSVSEAGISDDGNVITFAGVHSATGAGIYISLFNSVSKAYSAPAKILGITGDGVLDPGETHNDLNQNGTVETGEDEDGFDSFATNSRVSLNRTTSISATSYTVAFLGTKSSGPLGLHIIRAGISDGALGSVDAPFTLTEVGDTLPGLPAAVEDIALHDSINNGADLTFWVSFAGGQAVIKAADPSLEIVLDRDDNLTTPVDATDPTTSYVRIGLWDDAYYPDGEVRLGKFTDRDLIDKDKHRFYFRLTLQKKLLDATQIETLSIKWSTIKDSGGVEDSGGANDTLEVVETGINTGVFVSKAVMLVANDLDKTFFQAGNPGAALGNRIRLAKLEHSVYAKFEGTQSLPPVAADVPVFRRKDEKGLPADERHEVVFNVICYIGDLDGDPKTPDEPYVSPDYIARQVERAQAIWNQLGLKLIALPTIYRTIPKGVLTTTEVPANRNVYNTKGQKSLFDDLILATNDRTLTVTFLPLITGVNGHTSIYDEPGSKERDRFFILLSEDLDTRAGGVLKNGITLGHELFHALYNRDDAKDNTDPGFPIGNQYFTFNSNPIDPRGFSAQDVRVRRRIHFDTLYDQAKTWLPWATQERKLNVDRYKFPPGLAPFDSTTGNNFVKPLPLNITLNAPLPSAGGPYITDLGLPIQVSAFLSSDPDQPANTLIYNWDLDGDGIFGEIGAQAKRGDETGVSPTFLSSGLALGSLFTVFVEVTDEDGLRSIAQATIEIKVPVYQVPLPPIAEDTVNPAGGKVADVLKLHFSDANLGAKVGMAVTQADGNGAWQYSADGVAWLSFGVASYAKARLLSSTYQIRFVPAKNWNGQANIYFHAWDGSLGTAGGVFAITAMGDATPFSVDSGMANVQVNPVNDAPAWTTTARTVAVPNDPVVIAAGKTVAELVGSVFGDVDGNTPVGVAIIALTGSGVWEYSRDSGANWSNLLGVSVNLARLLTADDKVRFTPNVGFTGKATIQSRAWDGFTGVAGNTANLSGTGKTGGGTAFSTNLLTLSTVINTAPTLGSATGLAQTTNEDKTSSPVAITSLLSSAQAADGDAGALKGAAIVGATGPGAWQFSLDGIAWLPLGTVAETSARLLASSAKVRFVPIINQVGQATLLYRAWDQTLGASGALFTITSTGGASPFSATEATSTLTINAVNDAPTWTAAATTVAFPNDAAVIGAGTTVGDAAAGLFADADANTVAGVAVVAVTGAANGTWEYSLDAGATWNNLETASASLARLLTAVNKVRFIPSANFTGKATIQVRAWDGSSGAAGDTANLVGVGKTGGTTSFSTNLLTVTTLVNSAPTLASATGPALTTNEDKTSAALTATNLLNTAQAADTDAGALKGVAIVDATGPGTWQYSLNGTVWMPIGAVAQTQGRLLPSTASVRFVPAANQNGQATLTYRAWDQTAGAPGALFAIAGNGGASAFSITDATSTLTITPINDAPVVDITVKPLLTAILPSSTPPGDLVANVLAGAVTDADPNALRGLAVVALTGLATGVWEYSLDNGASWQTVSPVLATSALLLRDTDRIRYVPNPSFLGKATFSFKAWDQTIGAAGDRVTTITGTSFSEAILTATALVNTAPVLN